MSHYHRRSLHLSLFVLRRRRRLLYRCFEKPITTMGPVVYSYFSPTIRLGRSVGSHARERLVMPHNPPPSSGLITKDIIALSSSGKRCFRTPARAGRACVRARPAVLYRDYPGLKSTNRFPPPLSNKKMFLQPCRLLRIGSLLSVLLKVFTRPPLSNEKRSFNHAGYCASGSSTWT